MFISMTLIAFDDVFSVKILLRTVVKPKFWFGRVVINEGVSLGNI